MAKNICEKDTKTPTTKLFLIILVINLIFILIRSSGANDKLSLIYLSRFIVPIITLITWSWVVYLFNFVIKKATMIKTMLFFAGISTIIFISVHYFILTTYCIPEKISPSCDFIRNNKSIIENLISYYSLSLISSFCIISLFLIRLEDNIPKQKISIKITLSVFSLIILSITGYLVNKDLALLSVGIILFLPFLNFLKKPSHIEISANMLFIALTTIVTLIPILFSISQEKTFLN